jgi:hypothetical protein
MPDLPRQIRLAAGDYFMHGQDRRMRRIGLPGNVCCAVHRLGSGLDVELLRQRIAASPILDWLARVRICRPFPVLPPLWRTLSRPRAILYEHNDPNGSDAAPWPLPQVVADRELHAARGPALTFDLVRHADGIHRLFLSWNHTLLDARGVDLLLKHLNAGSTASGAPAVQDLINPKQMGWDLAGWWPNARRARGSVEWLRESGREPIFTLLPTGLSVRSRRNSYRVVSFSPEETGRIGQRCQLLNAGFRRSHFYLAATLRALHDIAVRRGNKTGAYLVPAPHDTRRRGANGPIFSNHLSILFYRIEPHQCGKLGDILDELGRQMTNQIRDRFPESCMAALDMFKPLPLGFYIRHLGKPTRGKFATLSFSDSGETCAGMTELFGGRILDVTHLVPTWRPPGLTVVFLNFSGRLSALLSWVDDCLSPAEADVLERGMRGALLEEAVP